MQICTHFITWHDRLLLALSALYSSLTATRPITIAKNKKKMKITRWKKKITHLIAPFSVP